MARSSEVTSAGPRAHAAQKCRSDLRIRLAAMALQQGRAHAREIADPRAADKMRPMGLQRDARTRAPEKLLSGVRPLMPLNA